MNRRNVIFAAAGLGALGLSEALRPRRKLMLLQGGTIDASLPRKFDGWTSQETAGLIGPELAGRVTKALYSQIVPRLYLDDKTGDAVMLLAAYGDTQSDLLQLHRPEFCYPAVGFNLEYSKPSDIPVGRAVLPVRRIIATMEGRSESIVYWTRVGEALPRSASEQRSTRIKNSIDGIIPDGILMRASCVGDPKHTFEVLDRFVPALLQAIPKAQLKAFVGSTIAQRVA